MLVHILAAAILWSACGGSVVDRTNKALNTALSATNAARDQFTKWDAQHQLAIVDKASTRTEAETNLKTYRTKRQRIVQAFTVAYTSMATAAVTIPLVQAGKRPERDLLKLLVASMDAVQTVIAGVKDIGDAFQAADAIGTPVERPDRPPNAEPGDSPGPTTQPPPTPDGGGS